MLPTPTQISLGFCSSTTTPEATLSNQLFPVKPSPIILKMNLINKKGVISPETDLQWQHSMM